MADDDKAWPSAPPFDHIVVGLPGEVVEIPPAEPGRGKKWRIVAAVGVSAVVLAGGFGAAQAMQQGAQSDDSASKVLVEVSRDALKAAADKQGARTALAELVERAREVDEDARELLPEEDAAVVDDLAAALAQASEVLDVALEDVELSQLSEATEALRSATEEAERSLDHEVSETLSDALDEANEVLGWSVGSVLNEIPRIELQDAVDEAQDALDAGDGSPRALAAMTDELVELTQAVRDAVAAFQQQAVQPQIEERPAREYVPPAAPAPPRNEPSNPRPAPAPEPAPEPSPSAPEQPVEPPSTPPTEPTAPPADEPDVPPEDQPSDAP